MTTDSESYETWLWPCLEARARARLDAYSPQEKKCLLKPTLHAFLSFLPEGGRESMAKDILKANSDEELRKHFHHVFYSLLVPMTSPTDPPSAMPSPYLNPKCKEAIEQVPSRLDHPVSRFPLFKSSLLRRDDFKCMITRLFDTYQLEKTGNLENGYHSGTEGAHIVPFGFVSNRFTEKNESGFASLYRYFPEVQKCGLRESTINDTFNGMTLSHGFQREFGLFHIALKPDGVQDSNNYEFKIFGRFSAELQPYLPQDLNHVRFQQASADSQFSLPSPALLECHWRMAEILHTSGMGKHIEGYLEDPATGCLPDKEGTTNFATIQFWEIRERNKGKK